MSSSGSMTRVTSNERKYVQKKGVTPKIHGLRPNMLELLCGGRNGRGQSTLDKTKISCERCAQITKNKENADAQSEKETEA